MPNSFSKDPVIEPDSIDEAKERKIYLDFLYKQAPSDSRQFFGANASILFHADIVDRAFGSALLSVSRLRDWINSKGLHLITKPPINDFEFVQVEALLCAIERAASDGLTHPQAETIVRVSKTLADDPAVDIAAPWLIGADAHQQWRGVIVQAVQHGELALLDFGSKLPIQTVPAQTATPPAPVAALGDEKQSIERIRYEVLASRSQLIETFGYYGVELKMFKALKDRPGLLAAYRVKGRAQKGSRAEPMFCPFEVINWLVKTGVKEKPR